MFRETDIRPDHLMQGLTKAGVIDIQWLLQHKDAFVHVPCPACGSKNASEVFKKYELAYMICSDCATMYINPRPTPAILETYYTRSENYRYWNEYIFPISEEVRREKLFRPRVERIADICRRNNIENGILLEVGAGFGTFCEEAQRLFHRVIAVEPTPDLAETCRRKGLEVIEKPIEQAYFEKDVIDVIASFEVIEHLFSPKDFLLRCGTILKRGGLLVITCPNVKGFDIGILQALSNTVDVEHLNYFHPVSLSQLIEKCGFEVLEITTPGKLDAELVRKKILSGELDISSQPFLKQILIDEWEQVGNAFQRFLADNLLSSHMYLVGRKL